MAKFTHHPAIEFWLGRAGSGKTHGCLAAIADLLRESARGEPLLLIAPEQATAQLERRLACWPGLAGGFTRARVFSFHHLANEAFLRRGGRPRRAPNELGRLMLIRRAMREARDELLVFRGSGAGLPESLAAMLLEMERYGWKAPDLADWRASLPEAERRTDLLARKLADLEILWRKYQELLAEGGWEDPAAWTEAAAAAISSWEGIAGARVWVDGFASLTAQETALLEALLGRARSAAIALCVDPAIGGAAPARDRIGPERLFENVEQTYYMLRDRFRDLGWAVSTRTIPADPSLTRHAGSPALAHLERDVIDRLDPRPFAGPSASIELIEADDRRTEIEAAARRLAALCRLQPGQAEPAMAWREAAVLARDLEPYEDLVREIFRRWGIPFFLDRPRRIFGHPLARLILSAIELVRSGWRGEAFLQHLKCGLNPVADLDAIARLENLVLATDTEGRSWRQRLERDPEAALWLDAVAPAALFERELEGGAPPAQALWALLESVRAAERIDAWIAEARAAGREEDAMLHEQAWEQTVGWIETLGELDTPARLFFKPPGSREEFRDLVDELGALAQTALASTQARLIPPTLDQVTVGSVDRSRTPEIKALFVLGLNEREFPRLWSPDPILGDEERGRMELLKRLGPDSRHKTLHEQYLAYIALTRSAGRLVLSRPLRDEDGKPTDPSPCFRRVRNAFPQAPLLNVGRAGEGDFASLPLRPEEWALRLTSAADSLGAPEQAARLAALMGAGDPLDCETMAPAERAALAGARALLAETPTAAIEPAVAREYWTGRGSVSVTALEHFSACPFAFFATMMLGIEEREQWRLGAMDLGSIRHGFLEAIYLALRAPDGTLDWGGVDMDRAGELVDRQIARFAADPDYADRVGASALTRMQLDRIGSDILLFIAALKTAAAAGRFIQVDAERRLDQPEPWILSADGLTLRLSGKIDRIDAAASGTGSRPCVLIDYKSGRRKINFARMVGGFDLQLLAYGLAWRRMRPADWVGGIFYWPLAAPTRKASRGSGGAPLIDAEWFAGCGPAGIFDCRIADLLDGRVAPGGKSVAFHFRRNADGSLAKTGQHWPAGALDRLLDHAETILADHLRRIAAGRIELAPSYATPRDNACAGCACAPLCRRCELERVPYRRIGKLTRDEAIAIVGGGA
ncbi:MAG: PD-(D/E)XK nuclease family protein [Candidatus Sumerlaeia bacterium]